MTEPRRVRRNILSIARTNGDYEVVWVASRRVRIACVAGLLVLLSDTGIDFVGKVVSWIETLAGA